MFKKKKICFVLTTEFAVKAFLMNHLRALSEVYAVTVIVNTSNPNFLVEQGVNAKVITLAIARDISWFSDFCSLAKLIKLFRKERFSSVHSITPKAGLLAMLAAWTLRVPFRLHTFTGQVWVTKTGFNRLLLKWFDRLIASLSTHNIVDSSSQRQFLIDEKVLRYSKSIVFAKGSISGVDIARFKPNLESKIANRQQLHIPTDAIIFLFLGRLTRDKGVLDLAHAFHSLNASNSHLLFVGPDEQDMQQEIKNVTESCNGHVHFVGHTDVPESYMATADVLCLPSYREGFGNVIIEAAAVGIPAIGTRIYGLTDAIDEEHSGLLFEPRHVAELISCMKRMIEDPELRIRLGNHARTRALNNFSSKTLSKAWLQYYQDKI